MNRASAPNSRRRRSTASRPVPVNQYEHGKHEPDYGTLQRLAAVLDVPTAYLYAEDDLLAEVILLLHPTSDAQKRKVLRLLSEK